MLIGYLVQGWRIAGAHAVTRADTLQKGMQCFTEWFQPYYDRVSISPIFGLTREELEAWQEK